MSKHLEFQVKELQRQVKGMQRQIGVVNARQEVTAKQHERRIRDLEIKTAVTSGVPQKKVAEIFEMSAGRVSQIMKRVA
jgi:hypothetical protein